MPSGAPGQAVTEAVLKEETCARRALNADGWVSAVAACCKSTQRLISSRLFANSKGVLAGSFELSCDFDIGWGWSQRS